MKKYLKTVNNPDVDNMRYNTLMLLIFIGFNVLITAVLVLVTR
jgi:hypothetical protein